MGARSNIFRAGRIKLEAAHRNDRAAGEHLAAWKISGQPFSGLPGNSHDVISKRLNDEGRTEFLASVFSYLGDEYDFYFDFADSSRLVCTEMHYRALPGKGGIDFTLTKRGGHETLSADDIVHYCLETRPRQFNIILYADEGPKGPHHQARLLLGGDAEHHLRELMSAGKSNGK